MPFAGIRVRLLLLVATCTLPVLALLLYDARHSSQQQMDAARLELRARAKGAADDLERDIASARQLLQSMSRVPVIADVNSPGCSRQLALLAVPYAQIGAAVGLRLDGSVACTTTAPAPSPGPAPNFADRDYFRKALRYDGVVQGDPIVSRGATANYILPLALATRGGDGLASGVLLVTVNLTHFAANDAATWTDAGTAVEIWDGEGRVAFRWPEAPQAIGKPFSAAPAAASLLAATEGQFDAPGADGAERVFGYVSVPGTELKLGFSVPTEVQVAPIRQTLGRNLALLAVIVLAAVAVSLALGEAWVRRPLARLAGVAERMRSGDLQARYGGGYPGNEIGVTARSFDNMAEALAAQVESLQIAQAQLRDNLERATLAERRVRQQLQHMNLLDQITRSIGERLDLQSIFQVVAVTLEDSLPVDFCCVMLHDAQAGALRVERVGTKSQALAGELALDEKAAVGIDNNGLSRCMGGELVYEADITQARFPFPEKLAAGGLSALVLAPLRSESRVFGVLAAARRQGGGFSSVECEFLRQLSEHIALAAGQAQLHGALQQAYDDLRHTQEAAMQEERLRALGQMASGIAHDINNALSPVSIYAESLLETETALSERARGYLVTIARAVEDVAQTVARMREFYRRREEQVTLTPVEPNRLVKQVLELTRARWRDMPLQKGVVIDARADLAPEAPSIMGVESEIREALTNLVFNAVDAMPEGGTLTLRTRLLDAAGADRGTVAIEVADEGVGMDEETRRRCLEPFFTTKGERGTGLGLAMVFGAAQRHSAELEIDSAPGGGTTVRLLFAVPEVLRAEQGAGALPAPPRGLRLLLIDDDPVLLNSLCDALQADGHVVITANGGKEGVAAFRTSLEHGQAFGAVFTDLGMPYMDGRRVAAEIKQASASTPVILLTGWGRRLVADGDIPAHVDRVLPKPPKLRELREALGALCAARPA